MPWADGGFTERQAAAHLLERFTFGPAPGLIDEVLSIGLEQWFSRQLEASLLSVALDQKLSVLQSLTLSNDEIIKNYPRPGQIRRQMIEEGRLDEDLDPKEQRRMIRAYYDEKGYRPQRQLLGELIAQKVFRAVESPNQVEEVMVDFWFNHFYVSATDNQSRRYIGTYERDAIRPYVFGNFGTMLEATAKHPAMLRYLDNAQSSAGADAATTASLAQEEMSGGPAGAGYEEERRKRQKRAEQAGQRRGINENYARELLELHTLGVDGGYTQGDVIGVARALTGWTVLPEGERRDRVRERMERNRTMSGRLGFVIEGDFLFNAEWHDAGEKEIMGVRFGKGGGLREGEDVLEMLARHPSTAGHIAYKLSVRFVSDTPPEGFVATLAAVFEETDGDMRAMLWQIVRSPEFWNAEVVGAKIKSPFELVTSSVRGLDATVRNPRGLVQWIERMGQPLYRYQAPTGFPDRAEMWVNAGSLLHRMNFGLSLAAGQVAGVRVDIGALREGREPESIDAALRLYATALLPERDLGQTVETLRPLVGQPDIAAEIRKRSDATPDVQPDMVPGGTEMMDDEMAAAIDDEDPFEPDEEPDLTSGKPKPEQMSLAQVVGLILGSPEFQRR